MNRIATPRRLQSIVFRRIAGSWVLLAACSMHAGAQSPPTFNRDIAPIIFNRCSACHQPEQSAPFSLLTYDDVQKRARQIAQVTHDRFMPPWLPSPAAGCVSLMGERRLTGREIELIQQWVADGTPEGDPGDLPPAPKLLEEWPLGKPDMVLTLGEPCSVPPEAADTLRTFVLHASLPFAQVVKAIDFRPGNPRAIHHASFLIDTTGSAQLLDGEDPQPGYRGMGDIGLNLAGSFGTWSPGCAALKFPDGIGRAMPKECDLIVEVHFNPTGKPEIIQPSVALYFVREPIEHRAVNVSLGSFFLDIPAGESSYRINDSFTLPVDARLLTIAPHAHYICRRMKAGAALPDGSVIDLLLIPDWDFNWQQEYRCRTPINLPAGTTVSMEFLYDNSAENPRNPNSPPKRIRVGSTAADEMALLFLGLIAVNEQDRPRLEQAHKDKLMERMKQAQIRRGQ